MDFYFKEEPKLDKPVLTSDCGSDVSAGAERERLWDWNQCACHCLNVAIQAALKEEVVHEYLEPLTALAARFSKSRSLWNKFKKTQMSTLHWEEERNDDEGEADFDGDEDLEVGGEGGAPLEESLAIDQTCADTLELDILPRETSIGIEGGISAVCGSPCIPP